MTECEHCRLMEDKTMVIFEDDEVVAVLSDKPVVKGHVLVMPRQHFTILEQVPDNIVEKVFITANRVSTALFELMRLNGTNILVENGTAAGQTTPHFAVNVIPRTENDGLKLSWSAKKFPDEQVSWAEAQLANELKEPEEKKVEESSKRNILEDVDSYLLKQLKRIP